MIGGCVSAEWLKLRKRPSVWVLATIVGAVILLFGYGFGYLFYTQAGSGEFQGMDPSAVLDSLLPAAVAENVLSILASFGAPVALVLGARLGYALATLFRGTGLAIGLGLVYLLVLETIVVSVPLRGQAAEILRGALLGQNGTALAQSFSTTQSPFLNQGQDLAEPAQATLVLLVYLIALAGIGALIFRRREVP